MKGLVLAGGEGSRLRPFTFSRPKHLIPLLGKPMIQYPVEDLVASNIKDLGIVIGYFGDMIKEFLGDGSRFDARFTYIVQEKRLGIAHAIYKAIEEGFLDKDFIVYLGDNMLGEGIEKHVKTFIESSLDAYILLSPVRDPKHFGVALVKGGKIVKLVEKPKEPLSDLAVIGIYMFRDPDLVARAFKSLRPSWRGEYEITELIQWFIERGHSVGYSIVGGWWKDIGTPEGLLDAIYLLLDKMTPRIEGIVEGDVVGRVTVEKNATVRGNVYGPAYIGDGALVDKSATIEHYVSIEKSAKILSGHITRSLILDNSEVELNRARLVNSVIGSKSRIRCSREFYGDIKLSISDHSIIEL
ncbi:MAG: glucose-1-phosphate thymidylyltransferase [Candidatus Bathyarchaeia archaeon]